MKRVFFLWLVFLASIPALASTSVTAILFDTSRSVSPEDFQKALEFVRQFVDESGPGDRVILYSFGNELRRITPEQLKDLQATESYTALFDAAYEAAQQLNQETADRKSVVIISDGKDTRSATILEDTAAYMTQHGMAIHGIGVGQVERKTLERIARLTGGKFFTIDTPGLVGLLREAQAAQETIPQAVVPPPGPQPVAHKPEASQPAARPPVNPPASQEKPAWSFSFFWLAAIAGGVIFLGVVGWVVAQAFKKEERTCPNCGRALESYQTICPSCPAASGPRRAGSSGSAGGGQREADLIPVELLERRPVTEEMLSKTFVLMEAPVLVIRKGRGVGQTFSLNRVYPVSIGRSRVNEIKLEDISVSGQHCRILPENGRHVLYDMGSTNGTFVNEKRVTKLVLTEGDIIKIGETQLLYKVEQQRN